jgi:MFS transporter, DHA1 family, multidrug resistance protein
VNAEIGVAGPSSATPRVPIWLLVLITLSGTLAMHIFVPALPAAAADFGVGIGAIQATISIYILGLAFGQLIYGPLSDRFGRRSMLMIGLALFTAGGVAAALAPDLHALLAARLLQALGGCAGLALGRAIVRDTSTPQFAARRLALVNLMVAIGPAAAPIIGGALAVTAGWRYIFALLSAMGVATLVLTWRLLPETGPASRGGSAASLAHDYLKLLGSPSFIGYCVGGGCATTSLYAFVAAAPFILSQQLHVAPFDVGPCLAVLIFGMLAGNGLVSRLVARFAIGRLLLWGNAASALASFVFLGAALTEHLSLALIMVSMFVFAVGIGVAGPMALTEAISVNPHVIGSASGLYGFMQMVVGAVCTGVVGIGANPAMSAAVILASAGVVAQLSFWLARRRRPLAVAAPATV